MIATTDCIFCQIVGGRSPASLVYDTDGVLAFMDIHPVNPGHLLVIPKTHVERIADVESTTAEHVFIAGVKLSAAIRESTGCEGVNLFVADGEVAGQEVFHFHLHVIPRFRRDGFGLRLPQGYPSRPSRETLDELAGRISRALASKPSF